MSSAPRSTFSSGTVWSSSTDSLSTCTTESSSRVESESPGADALSRDESSSWSRLAGSALLSRSNRSTL